MPDSHCHLDLIGGDPVETRAAAAAVGIAPLVTIGVDAPTSRWQAEVADRVPGVYAAVAIHPNEVDAAAADDLDEIRRLAGLPQVRAIGETGLDYFRQTSGAAAQQESFRAHIAIAKETGKALVIHDRDAHADVLRILEEEGPPERTVFHCFSGDAELARTCVRAGYVLSFAGNLTFASAAALRTAAAAVPIENLLVETDAPFLTPVPFRGRPNAPYLTPHTVRALAELTGVALEDLCVALATTAARIFGPW